MTTTSDETWPHGHVRIGTAALIRFGQASQSRGGSPSELSATGPGLFLLDTVELGGISIFASQFHADSKMGKLYNPVTRPRVCRRDAARQASYSWFKIEPDKVDDADFWATPK